jgi:hypothetical protein
LGDNESAIRRSDGLRGMSASPLAAATHLWQVFCSLGHVYPWNDYTPDGFSHSVWHRTSAMLLVST